MHKLLFSVTNDLVYDQRMNRICTSLANAGYDVTLIGRTHSKSPALQSKPFRQKRFRCFFKKGKLFYAEYNIKLFFILLFAKVDVYCAIDLDSILPNLLASKIRGKKRVYDAHELFCEMEEVYTRPRIYKMWKWIEKISVPHFDNGYTIGDFYAQEYKKMYNKNYTVVRNATVLNEAEQLPNKEEITYILYQGAVNEGRSFDTLIPAMQHVNGKMIICGNGNYFEQTKALITKYNLQDKITMTGYIKPLELINYTRNAYIGITIFSDASKSKSNYLSMGNRFFDYMHSAIPQICVNYPEYNKVNSEFEISLLVDDLQEKTLADAINKLLLDKNYYNRLRNNALQCRKQYCWQQEEKKLISFYKNILG
jgi:glycosyltransferase involved in cell wall biosynthesis